MQRKNVLPSLLIAIFLVAATDVLFAAPDAELWPRWEAHNPESSERVDHEAFGRFLDSYLITDDPSGVNLIPYGEVTEEDRQLLVSYVDKLESIEVSQLSRPVQFAYWVNLYNAFTLELVLEHYPVDSIRDIKLGGLFSSGPWNAGLLEIEAEEVSLNDIEHRILRPIWKDERIHYAVNCASMGCPNLQPEPFTAENSEELLERGARNYINHPRGAHFEEHQLVVSSIYDWYQEDFGGTVEGVINHLLEYAEADPATGLAAHEGGLKDTYDWSLNEP